MPSVQLIYAQMQQDRLDSVRRNLLRVLPVVDRAIIVDNGSTDGTREWLRTLAPKVLLVERGWNDSFVEGRNAYMEAVEGLADGPTVLCTADDDELYSDALLRDLRKIAEEMYLEDFNILRVRSRSVETDWKGDEFWSKLDDWHKPLVYVWEPGIRYVGVNNSQVHEDIHIPSGYRPRVLDSREGLYRYDHVKRYGEIWPRAIRNAFAGGGGMNLGELCPWWRDFQRTVREEAGAKTSGAFVRLLRDASQLPPEIDKFLVSKRFLGTRWDLTPPLWPGWPDGCSEWREGWLARYVYFRPDQMPLGLAREARDIGYMNVGRAARVIHGPAAPGWAQDPEWD